MPAALNCKPGDRAMVVGGLFPQNFRRLVRVVRWTVLEWYVEMEGPPGFTDDGDLSEFGYVADCNLRPQ